MIDRENALGGCHRVVRQNGARGNPDLFTEHSPRVYSDSYLTFRALLKDMGIDFYDAFVKYNHGTTDALKILLKTLKLRDWLGLGIGFGKSIFLRPQETVKEFAYRNNLSVQTFDLLDRLCRLLEGASADRFTMEQLFKFANTQILYGLFQPKQPNDTGLFKAITEKLINQGVEILLSREVSKIELSGNSLSRIRLSNNQVIEANKYLFAIPPKSMLNILSDNTDLRLKSAFGDFHVFNRFVKKTNYLPYMTVMYYWEKSKDISDVWGLPEGVWGVININMGSYFIDKDMKVLSVTISKTNVPDDNFDTALDVLNEQGEERFAEEIINKLKLSLKRLPDPDDYKIIRFNDTAFVKTKSGYLDRNSSVDNLYSIGTHNGNSKFIYTTFESAVQNALDFVHEEIPKSKKEKIRNSFGISQIFNPSIRIFHRINSQFGMFFGENSIL